MGEGLVTSETRSGGDKVVWTPAQRRGLGLRWRLLLILIGLPLLLLVPASVVVSRLYVLSYREAFFSKAGLAIQVLDQRIREVLPYDDPLTESPDLQQIVRDTAASSADFDFAALVDQDGYVLLHSDPGTAGTTVAALGDLSEDSLIYHSGDNIYNVTQRSLPAGSTYLTWRPMIGAATGAVGDVFIVVAERASVVNPRIWPLIVVGLAIATLYVVVMRIALDRLVMRPLNRLAEGAAIVGTGDLAHAITMDRDDEFGIVADAFNEMLRRFKVMVAGLERRVEERTVALEKRSSQLEAISMVGQEAARERNVATLLETAANAITANFPYIYHAGIFILDDTRQWAILRAASSEGGKRMLARGHRLRVGLPQGPAELARGDRSGHGAGSGTGIVGYVAVTARSRIAVNVGDDVVWFNNPDLPATKSELALPLIAEADVVGVLDVQSQDVDAFNEEDINILQLMADQLTIALTNARALEGMQSALAELSDLQVDYARRGWARVTQRMRPLAYEYDRVETIPVSPLPVPEDLATGRVPHKIVMDGGTPVVMEALRVGDQVLGYLGLADARREWSQEELALVQSVGEQVALALDNARLFEDTQRNERQQVLINRVLQAASDPDLSTRQVLREIGRILAQGLDMAVLIFTFPYVGGQSAVEASAQIIAHTFVDSSGLDLMVGGQEMMLEREHAIFFQGLVGSGIGPSILPEPALGSALPGMGAVQESFNLDRVLYVPIVRATGAAARPEGFIGLYQAIDAPALDPDTRELTQNLASQIAVVLENLNLSEETQRRSEELRDLYRISLGLSELLEPDDVLGEIVSNGADLLGADAANLWAYDADTQMLALIYDYQGGAEGRLDRGQGGVQLHASQDHWEGLAGQSLAEERTVIVPDYATWANRRPDLVSVRFHAMMGVPLIGRFGPLGVLVVQSERIGFFTERTAGLAELFSAQAATALENARLNQEAQQRAQEFEQLYEAGTDLITILDSEELLTRAAEWARRVLGAARAVVFLRASGEAQDGRAVRYIRGQSASDPKYLPTDESDQPSSGGLTEYIIRTRRPLLIRDNTQFQDAADAQAAFGADFPVNAGSLQRLVEIGLMTQMGAPLRIGADVLGALYVNGVTVDQFSERDLSLLEFLAAQVSSALQNAIQFGQTEQALAVVGQQARYQSNVSQAVALLNERGTAAGSEFFRLLGEASEVPAVVYFRPVASSGGEADVWYVAGSWLTDERPSGAVDVNLLRDALLRRLPDSQVVSSWAQALQSRGSTMIRRQNMLPSGQEILADSNIGVVLALAVPEESAIPGAVVLFREDPPEGFAPLWGDQEVVALQTAAAALSNTLARERLFEQVQETLNETEALYRGSAALSEASTYEGILDVLLAHTLLGAGASAATLHLFDQVWSGDTSPAAMPTYSEPVAARTTNGRGAAANPAFLSRIALSDFPVASTLMQSGSPWFIEDVAIDNQLDARARALFEGASRAGSVVLVPLVVGGQRIGYLHAEYASPQRFGEAARRRLVNLSQQAAIAVLNLRQLRATQARVERERMIREITGRIQEAPDVEGVLTTAVRELGRAFGTSRNRIQFRPPESDSGAASEDDGGRISRGYHEA